MYVQYVLCSLEITPTLNSVEMGIRLARNFLTISLLCINIYIYCVMQQEKMMGSFIVNVKSIYHFNVAAEIGFKRQNRN